MPIRQDAIPDLLTPELTAAFLRAISPERWNTYEQASGYRPVLAHRLYLWNAAIGQSFHFPLQTAEVALRNVVHQALVALYGANWSANQNCRDMLDAAQNDNIRKAERRHYRIHGANATTPQIVASLSLGFWVSMLRRDYDRAIWDTQSQTAFPHLGDGETMVDVSAAGTQIQTLRNRIFHQEPLIGHNLSEDYAAILRMIGWICPHIRTWTRTLSSVPRVIRERPR